MRAQSVPVHLKLALSLPEAGEMIGLSDTAVARLVEQGYLARVPHTHRVLIARAELERFVTSSMRPQAVA